MLLGTKLMNDQGTKIVVAGTLAIAGD